MAAAGNAIRQKLRKQLEEDVNMVSASAGKKLNNIKQYQAAARTFTEKINAAEKEITEKFDQLILLLQAQRNKLIEELNAFKEKILRKVESEKDEIYRQFLERKRFASHVRHIFHEGTACDISRTAHDLHARAEELVKTQDEPDCQKLGEIESAEIMFKPSAVTINCVNNFIGKLSFSDDPDFWKTFNPSRLPVCLTPGSFWPALSVGEFGEQPYTGITVLGREMFVVRGTSEVEVYSADGFFLIRKFAIPGSKQLQGIASCSYTTACISLIQDKGLFAGLTGLVVQ